MRAVPRTTLRRVPCLALAAVLALAACGTGSGTDSTIAVSGSSTVAPISAFVADEYGAAGHDALVFVDDPGTGDGIASFCEGEVQVAGASRRMLPEELAGCERSGIRPIELEVALDGITVLVPSANDRVDCLTVEDLTALFGPDAEGTGSWEDAEANGATSDLPDLPLDITAPGVESGTYDAFVELVVERVDPGAEGLRRDYSSQADDNSIIAGIEGSRGGLGFVGFAFATGAGDGVRPVAVDAGDGCVEPTAETIADGTYPIARSLYVYVDAGAAEADPEVARYIDVYLSDLGLVDLVREAGYVPLPPERAAATRARWERREVLTATDADDPGEGPAAAARAATAGAAEAAP